ncbi:conserved protein of unknown function [Hydrogenimonas sp.]|nr:conserved protein of unknown function [Hydrogenimonas sp.]
MTFLEGWALWLLIPVALLALGGGFTKAGRKLPLHEKIVLEDSSGPRFRALQTAALALMVIALARPVYKNPSTLKSERSAPVYLALDLSASMRATDREPSRLEYSKEVIRNLLKIDRVHPFGLFGFTSNTLILSPATMDRRLVEAALESINQDFIITRSTSLDSVIQTIAGMPEKRKRIVILSDGGDERDLGRALRICRENGIKIFAVEAASKSGAKIPKAGGGFVRDEEGRLVISMRNQSFAELAALTGGEVIDEEEPSKAAAQIESALADDDFISETTVEVSITELFPVPISAALLLFFISVARVPKRPGRLKIVAALSALLGVQQADASIFDLWYLERAYEAYERGDFNSSLSLLRSVDDSSLQRSFAEASALYRVGAYKSAARIFASIKSSERPVKSSLLYDLGNCAVKTGHFKAARGYYVKSLQLYPEDDALENLSAILFADERRGKKPPSRAARKRSGSGTADRKGKWEEGKSGKSKSSGAGESGSGGAEKGGRTSKLSSRAGSLKHPLGSKAYELINKGYIDERKPW